MQATTILMNEHRVIEQVLDCLDALIRQATGTRRFDAASALQILDFLRNFADKCHHGKEEDLLFPLLEKKGFSRERGPTGVMMHEHTLGRLYIKEMAQAIPFAERGDQRQIDRFSRIGKAYVQLLREHIRKEDHCLFEMAEQVCSAEDDAKLLDAYAEVEHEDIGDGVHEKYLHLADELAERFGVTRSPTLALAGCGCGHAH